jgi:RNA polymerase sigma-70 factor (ECF subfamily)
VSASGDGLEDEARLGRTADARESYERALALTKLEPERRFLQKRLLEIEQK